MLVEVKERERIREIDKREINWINLQKTKEKEKEGQERNQLDGLRLIYIER